MTLGAKITAPTPFERASAIVILVVFGLTWPVLELLAENAEFFLARKSQRLEILGLGLVLLVAAPLLLSLLGIIPGRIGSIVAAGAIAILGTGCAYYYLSKLPISWWLALLLGVGVGAAITYVFFRFSQARMVAKYLLWSPLVFVVVFLIATPSGAIVLNFDGTPGAPATMESPAPLVLLIFDEFPVASLMAPDGSLRSDHFPNFARLASDGIWYRNAMTVEQQTEHSVPAILTGVVPDQSLTPYAGQYPNSLFTALQESHELDINEAITQLCPSTICEGREPSTTPLYDDVLVVAGHVLLPDPMSEDLPPIDRSWGDFTAATEDFNAVEAFLAEMENGERAPIEELISAIRSYDGDKPPFFFLHALTPHHPWHTLPDGREYPLVLGANPASFKGGFIDDDYLVAQGMQRHLLQVGFADHMLGEIISALEDAGLYDQAILVVTADHGIAVKPGVKHQRTITPDTVGDIAAVPLFVKLPGNDRAGVVDDRRALTIDLVPTIEDALDADFPWRADGSTLLGTPPDRVETTTIGPNGPVTYGVDGLEKFEVAQRIEGWFPGGDPYALLPAGSPDILNDDIDVSTLATSAIKGRIHQPALYRDVDTNADVIPVRVVGTLSADIDGPIWVGVAANGKVAAVVRSYVKDDTVGFQAMIPPDRLVDGDNQLELFQVLPDGELLRMENG